MPRLDTGPQLPFFGERKARPEGWPERDRGLYFSQDRMNLFPRAARKLYKEDRIIVNARVKEDQAIRTRLSKL